jgi:L-iditol 2-dehydrogenase
MDMSQESMRGVMYLAPGEIELRQVPIPEPGPDEVLVKVRTALTDGTDLKTFRRGHPNITPPVLFGHEFAGDIVEVGAEVTRFQPGMRIVPHNSAPCHTCYYCKRGQHSMCDNLFFNKSGAYAEYAVVPGNILKLNAFEIPDHLTYAQAAVMEPLSCVVHGQDVIRIQPGETVAIIGAGGSIGLMHLQLALQRGATQVIAVDLKDNKLALAEQLGATRTINADKEDPVELIKELTGGHGVDVAIESAGAVEAWESAVNTVRKGGRVLWFGGLKPGTMIELDTKWVHYGELTLYGVFHATPIDVQRAFDFISSGIINTEVLITGELPLERLEDALQMMIRGDCVKMAIRPDLEAGGQ